jgi:cyclase
LNWSKGRVASGRSCADATLAASIFHFGIHDVRELKAQLQREGILMRLPC